MNVFLIVAALLLPASGAFAEDIEGIVHVVGSAVSQKVILTEVSKGDGPAICHGDVGKRISHLTGMTVKATGDWLTNKSGEKYCVDVKDFVVLKLANGRMAVVGTLGERNGAFQVLGDNGKARSLVDVPDGLKKLSGKKVILDLKVIESPAAHEVPAKVVSYSEYP